MQENQQNPPSGNTTKSVIGHGSIVDALIEQGVIQSYRAAQTNLHAPANQLESELGRPKPPVSEAVNIVDALLEQGAIQHTTFRRPAAAKPESELRLTEPATNEPVDILANLIKAGVVEDQPDARKNFRRSAAAKLGHARRRKRRRELKEALAATVDPPPPPCRRPGPLPIGQRRYDRIVRVMEPGRWYARGDLARAAGFGLNARGELMRTLLANALATRARNPDAGKGPSHNPEPLWLYRLTPGRGEALREALQTLM